MENFKINLITGSENRGNKICKTVYYTVRINESVIIQETIKQWYIFYKQVKYQI